MWTVRNVSSVSEDVIFVMSKAAVQAAVVGAIEGVTDETGRRITASPQVFGQGRKIRGEVGPSI